MSQYLFLYGTLLPGQAPAELAEVISRLRPIGPGYIHGFLYDLGEYPGAVLAPPTGATISGHVFELPFDGDVLASLDEYEGFDPDNPEGSLFIRTKSLVTLQDGSQLECWVYLYNRDPKSAPLVVGGDYLRSKGAEQDEAHR
jgi:gamma-glutamylcyclotransferase (GGCT)/AIG2-like uncharacterized protein YtfP